MHTNINKITHKHSRTGRLMDLRGLLEKRKLARGDFDCGVGGYVCEAFGSHLKRWPERGDLTVVSKEVYFFPARFLSFCDSVLILPILFLRLSVQEPSKNFIYRLHAAWRLHVKMNETHINEPFYVLPGPQNVKSIVDIPTFVLPCAVVVFCTCPVACHSQEGTIDKMNDNV